MDIFLGFVIGSIPTAIITHILSIRQSNIAWEKDLEQREKEILILREQNQLLREQLDEQKKQREFEEKKYQEQNQPKMPLSKWNIEG